MFTISACVPYLHRAHDLGEGKLMRQKTVNFLSTAFYLIFGLLFLSLLLRLMVRRSAPHPVPLAMAAVLVLVLMALAYQFLGRHENFLNRHYPRLLAGFLVCSGIIQLASANILRFQPVFDLGAVYHGAIEWVNTGTFAHYYDYYYYFPNNLGGMAFLAAFFSLARGLGITDYFMVASVVNGLCVVATILTTATICKKLLGVKQAVFALLLFAVSLPFWFMAAVFYTDSLSILFPTLILFLYLKVGEGGTIRRQIIWIVLLGASAVLGMLIKFTVAIMVIAIVIDSLFHRPLKQTGMLAGISIAIICAGFFSFQAMIYPAHLDRDTAKVYNTPYLHWVMMGLQGEGAYNAGDYEFTRSFTDPDERDAALVKEVKQRLTTLGPSGLYKLFWAKTTRSFSCGTYNQSDFLDDNPERLTWLHSFLLYDGENYPAYRAVCQAIFLAILALMDLSALQEVFEWKQKDTPVKGVKKPKRKGNAESAGTPARAGGEPARRPTWYYLAPQVAVFGAMLFFAGWETSGRYITNYIPVILLSAVMGIDCWSELVGAALNKAKKRPAA